MTNDILDNNDLITGKECAELARVHEETIKRWRKAGRLKGVRVGPRLIRYRRSEVTALISVEAL